MILRFLFLALGLGMLWPQISGAVALFVGMAFALTVGNPYSTQTKKLTPLFLQISIVGLGMGMNLEVVARAGAHGFIYTCFGIAITLALGLFLGHTLKSDRDTSLLVSVGTAICGGSAIAAVAPVIQASSQSVSIALATVFCLNAIALFIFPWAGHSFGLSETQFGLWSALAVHDTSSVVGTAMQYGASALEIATTVKLARALWIVPVAIAIGHFWTRNSTTSKAQKTKRPWFILGFLIAAALVTWIPLLKEPGEAISNAAKRTLVLTLFLIGSGLTRSTLKSIGPRPFILGLSLWILVSAGTLAAILAGWIA